MLTVFAVTAPLWREGAAVRGPVPAGGVCIDAVADASEPATAVLAATTQIQKASEIESMEAVVCDAVGRLVPVYGV